MESHHTTSRPHSRRSMKKHVTKYGIAGCRIKLAVFFRDQACPSRRGASIPGLLLAARITLPHLFGSSTGSAFRTRGRARNHRATSAIQLRMVSIRLSCASRFGVFFSDGQHHRGLSMFANQMDIDR